MNAGILAAAGLGVGVVLLLATSDKGSAEAQYQKVMSSDDLSWMDKDTDLLALSNELLSQGRLKEAKEIREYHTKLYAPHMSPEEITAQIKNWKSMVTDLYGVEWQ